MATLVPLPLGGCFGVVLSGCKQLEMGRLDTPTIIRAFTEGKAIVGDFHAGRDWASRQFPCCAVGTITKSLDLCCAVSAGPVAPSPAEARSLALRLEPKAPCSLSRPMGAVAGVGTETRPTDTTGRHNKRGAAVGAREGDRLTERGVPTGGRAVARSSARYIGGPCAERRAARGADTQYGSLNGHSKPPIWGAKPPVLPGTRRRFAAPNCTWREG